MIVPYHLITNPVAPPASDAAFLADLAWSFHQAFPPYRPTPLRRLDVLAQSLGVASLHVKDESPRFGLNAFKGLGGSFAMHHWVAQHDTPADAVFATASDGNHGRAVAWMARQLGMRAVVYLPAHTVPARIAAIQDQGARVELVAEGYDAAVRRAHEDAARNGWIVIQDTTLPGYQEVPRWIAAGYWTMARELESSLHLLPAAEVDLVVVHAGVGTWPAAMVEYYWHRYGGHRPRIVVIEPIEAACVLESVQAGHAVTASGSQRTIMAGLNCGRPSTIALDVLRNSVDAFVAIPDGWAEAAMRQLATPAGDDPAVIAGESGAAGLAGLLALGGDPALAPARAHLGIDSRTRILIWSTEGATDPIDWQRVVGRAVPS
ncbi:MAG TPA: diaminopropionate ammonia-lyase [Gemmatimonadales bacterium]|jgi:diaminopropionate ammonia-lyase